ncbi:unnamed protein product [Hymenolepis diminuta]|uniref:HOOK domain-containing protein n=1 Tax=Hymenolepis diminuta TaxID=6216 RepID=A0A0R3SWN6_HYMDI|nr:unnamed protein product [Hymenolepis diminuta]
MAGVRGAIQELRVQQTNLQADIEKIDAEIKQAQNENYEHRETLLMERIKKTEQQEKVKLDKIRKLQADFPSAYESLEGLNDAYDRQDKLLDELKEARELANKNDMMYEEVRKRLLHMEQSRDRMERRAVEKEAEALRLEQGFNDANSQVEVLRSKDLEVCLSSPVCLLTTLPNCTLITMSQMAPLNLKLCEIIYI